MADGFEAMVHDGQAFFRELAANNRKDWYEPRKEHYRDAIRKPAELFADLAAEDLSRLTGTAQKPKVFRLHRDVRFSKDKSPYNAHLHMLWSGGLPGDAGFFFAVEPDSIWSGMGVFGLQGPLLTRYRQFIDRHGDAVSEALEILKQGIGAEISSYGPAPLKRVPKPYDPEHPHGDLLKRKGLALGANVPPDWEEIGLLKAFRRQAEAYLPLWRLIADGL